MNYTSDDVQYANTIFDRASSVLFGYGPIKDTNGEEIVVVLAVHPIFITSPIGVAVVIEARFGPTKLLWIKRRKFLIDTPIEVIEEYILRIIEMLRTIVRTEHENTQC
jgi:hypothetical protein